jgi:hypothetical protein
MFSTETEDVLAMEYAVTYRNLEAAGVGHFVLEEIRLLAVRTIGNTAFQAALQVFPKIL